MGDALKKNHRYSLEEYEALALNTREGERYEYVDGQLVVKDEYTTDEHNLVLLNIYRLLHTHFSPKGCKVFTENVRLALDAQNQFRLPDIMVTCSQRDKTTGCEARSTRVGGSAFCFQFFYRLGGQSKGLQAYSYATSLSDCQAG